MVDAPQSWIGYGRLFFSAGLVDFAVFGCGGTVNLCGVKCQTQTTQSSNPFSDTHTARPITTFSTTLVNPNLRLTLMTLPESPNHKELGSAFITYFLNFPRNVVLFSIIVIRYSTPSIWVVLF